MNSKAMKYMVKQVESFCEEMGLNQVTLYANQDVIIFHVGDIREGSIYELDFNPAGILIDVRHEFFNEKGSLDYIRHSRDFVGKIVETLQLKEGI